MGKMMFMDLTRCTACRGCQVACKQWKDLPGEETRNTGSHQNPADLGFPTLKVVRFIEKTIDNKMHWLFFPDACRHCLEPPCMGQALQNPFHKPPNRPGPGSGIPSSRQHLFPGNHVAGSGRPVTLGHSLPGSPPQRASPAGKALPVPG